MVDEQQTPTSTLIVKRDDAPSTVRAMTPDGMPDVVLKSVSPWKIVLVRTARVFVQTLAGSITVASLSDLVGLKAVIVIAAATAGVTALQNTGELLAKLDRSFPEFRG